MHLGMFEGPDVEPLADVFAELFGHYFGDTAPSREAVRGYLAGQVLAAGSTTRVVVARDGADIAGLATFAVLHPGPGVQGQLFMKDLFVRQAWRGRGVGERLLGFLARLAVSEGCARLDWTTERDNPGAIRFYERLGASVVPEKVYFRLAGEALAAVATRGADGPAPG